MKQTKTSLIIKIVELDKYYYPHRSRLYAKSKQELIDLYKRIKHNCGDSKEVLNHES